MIYICHPDTPFLSAGIRFIVSKLNVLLDSETPIVRQCFATLERHVFRDPSRSVWPVAKTTVCATGYIIEFDFDPQISPPLYVLFPLPGMSWQVRPTRGAGGVGALCAERRRRPGVGANEKRGTDSRLAAWRNRIISVQQRFDTPSAELKRLSNPQEFERLVQEREQLDHTVSQLSRWHQERETLTTENEAEWKRVLAFRNAISVVQERFLDSHLANNPYVRMTVQRCGCEGKTLERELRELLEITDGRFEIDIFELENGQPMKGLVQHSRSPFLWISILNIAS